MTGDQRWMDLALSLGARGMGRTWPNPAVGCVLVKGGRVIGRGWTQPGGRPHAEAMALQQAGPAAKGATAYVTLEPCAHTGKTPPCSQALIKAGVARVVIALGDPDPRVAGRGVEDLTAAGIEVSMGVGADQAARDHAGFLLRTTQQRPFVTLKLASSFDGRIATAQGESKWITGPQSRRVVHAMRARHDAVLVGAGTARVDNPSLTVRALGQWNAPVRVILSEKLDIPRDGPLAAGTDNAPVWLIHGPSAPEDARSFWSERGARLFGVEDRDGVLSVSAAMTALAEAGITRVFCEGGAQLGASLLRANLVDELVGFTAGLALGGDGYASIAPLGFIAMTDAPRFDLADVRAVGHDILHIWRRA